MPSVITDVKEWRYFKTFYDVTTRKFDVLSAAGVKIFFGA